MSNSEVIAPASIEITPTGAVITGVPSLETWGAEFEKVLGLGKAAVWARTDLIGFAESERPYGELFEQYLDAKLISLGTLYNDRRRYNRYPRGHALRRLIPALSVSHFDAAAPLSDDDAETVLVECANSSDPKTSGREHVRARVREILNTPERPKLATTARFENGVLKLDQLEDWIREGGNYEVTIRPMKKAA